MNTTPVKGLHLIKNFLTELEEDILVRNIEDSEWTQNRSQTRQVQVSGPWHDSAYKTIPGKYTPHPEYSSDVVEMIGELIEDVPEVQIYITDGVMRKISSSECSELFVNEYNPGDVLSSHFDNRTTYDECIIGVSLLSDVVMVFSRGKSKIQVYIPQRSLYLITGEARYLYKHGIEEIRERRISLTYRTLNISSHKV